MTDQEFQALRVGDRVSHPDFDDPLIIEYVEGLPPRAGHERKTTGSYYTPASLIRVLLDSALDPVIEDRLNAVKNESLDAQEAGKIPHHLVQQGSHPLMAR